MKIAKRVKRDTIIVIISVFVLTVSTMRVAYSYVFSVKSQSSVQKIKSGELNVLIDDLTSTMASTTELFPTPEEELPKPNNLSVSGPYSKLVINNSGTLDSAFSVSISYDTEHIPTGKTVNDFIPFDYLIIGIYDDDNYKWYEYGSSYYTQISNLTPSETNVYPVLSGTIDAPAVAGNTTTRVFNVYIWLKEDTPISEIGKLAYLKLNVKSTTINDGINSEEN